MSWSEGKLPGITRPEGENREFGEIDYQATIKNLGEKLASRNVAHPPWPKDMRDQLIKLSDQLTDVANRLGDPKFCVVRWGFDWQKNQEATEGICDSTETIKGLQAMSEIAQKTAEEMSSKNKPMATLQIMNAAHYFLVVREKCHLPPPKKYVLDPAVLDFQEVLSLAGIKRSRERLKQYLAKAEIDDYWRDDCDSRHFYIYKSVG